MVKKRLIIGVFALIIFSLPIFAGAATFMADGNVSSGETVSDNLYVAGGNPVISGDVQGDLYVTGGNVTVSGNISGDIGAAGGNVTITGNVDGDVRMFGGSLYIDSAVGGDVISFGGQVVYGPNAKVGKDLVAGGGNVTIDQSVVVSGKTQIFEDKGEERMEQMRDRGSEFLRAAYWIGLFYTVIIYLVVAAVIMGLFPNLVKKYTKVAVKDGMAFWKNLGIGALLAFGIPLLSVLLFMSVIGALLGGILLAMFVVCIMINVVTAGFLFGGLMQKWLNKGKEVDWLWGLGGVVVLTVIAYIPVIGWMIGAVFFFWSFGTLASGQFNLLRSVK